MSFEEIEQQWQAQPGHKMSEQQALQWVRKNNLSDRFKWGALWMGLIVSAVHIPLRMTLLMSSETMHPINWFFECLFLAIPVFACIITMVGLWRRDQSRKACHQHLIQMLEHLVKTTNQEIKEIRVHSPIVMTGFLILFGFSRWAAYSTGYETAQKSLILFGLITAIICICSAGLYHRLSAFLIPRRDTLNQLVKELNPNQ